MPVIRVIPIPRRHTTSDEKFMKPRRRSDSRENAAYLYKFEEARPLPVIDLRRTLSHLLLGPQRNVQFLWWMKKYFELLHLGQVLGTLVTVVVIVIPREIGQVLGPFAAALSSMSVISTMATASLDVLRLLTHHYEFWFFSVSNLVTWSFLGYFLGDPLRVISLLPLWLNLQLSISLDANFRTFVVASSCKSSMQTKRELKQRWLFENALATLIPFIMCVLYSKRKLFAARSAGSKLVRCQLYRAQLVLRPVRYSRTASMGIEASSRSHVLHKQLGISAPEMSAASGNDTARHPQQITLVALRLSTVDTRKLVLSSWSLQLSSRLSISRRVGIYATGSAGLALTVATLVLPPGGGECTATHVIPIIGFLLTTAFCTVFACASQRDMLHALLFHNFGFLFSMMHCSVASFCVADMMNWDYRCWAMASSFLWFVWVQLLDAVTPPVRRLLSFSKLQIVPVLLLLWALMIAVAYAIVFLPVERTGLRGRELLHFHINHNATVLNTKSILLNRLFIMFFWMQRHAWNVFRGAFMRCWRTIRPSTPSETANEEIIDPDEEELATMRGSLEYFCPFETFPGIRRRISSLRIASRSTITSLRRTSLTGRHRVRRISSTILLSGVVSRSPEQWRQARRGAFGQRSTSSENDKHSSAFPSERPSLKLDFAPGMVPHE